MNVTNVKSLDMSNLIVRHKTTHADSVHKTMTGKAVHTRATSLNTSVEIVARTIPPLMLAVQFCKIKS